MSRIRVSAPPRSRRVRLPERRSLVRRARRVLAELGEREAEARLMRVQERRLWRSVAR